MLMEMGTVLFDGSPNFFQDREVNVRVFTSNALPLRDGFIEDDPPGFAESHVHGLQSSWSASAFLWVQ